MLSALPTKKKRNEQGPRVVENRRGKLPSVMQAAPVGSTKLPDELPY